MGYECRVIADSVSPAGKRLTSIVASYPRSIHSEWLTHRMFSRNSSSSRAIPIKKLMDQVMYDPAMPVFWGSNRPGMQAGDELPPDVIAEVEDIILSHRAHALETAAKLEALGMHKQDANRYLEPWMFITVIYSATEWDNFFKLRCDPMAHPSFQKIARMALEAREASKPKLLPVGAWHLPFRNEADQNGEYTHPTEVETSDLLIAVARCARVSYLTHEGQYEPAKDIELAKRLIKSGHWSPFEHVAQCAESDTRSGNFIGWTQYRESLDSSFIDEESFGEIYE